LHGWESVESTVFEYDGDRLIRTVTTREPEFDAAEVAYLLASREIESAPKNALGFPLEVAIDPANSGRFVAPTMPTTDFAVKALEDSKELYYSYDPSASRNGHVWRNPTLAPLPKEVDDGRNKAD
jgi:hypothetical protein